MHLPRALGFERLAPNFAQKAIHHVATSSRGRFSVPGLVAGLPVLVPAATGAKTGLPRTSTLLGIPRGDDIVLIGTG